MRLIFFLISLFPAIASAQFVLGSQNGKFYPVRDCTYKSSNKREISIVPCLKDMKCSEIYSSENYKCISYRESCASQDLYLGNNNIHYENKFSGRVIELETKAGSVEVSLKEAKIQEIEKMAVLSDLSDPKVLSILSHLKKLSECPPAVPE